MLISTKSIKNIKCESDPEFLKFLDSEVIVIEYSDNMHGDNFAQNENLNV